MRLIPAEAGSGLRSGARSALPLSTEPCAPQGLALRRGGSGAKSALPLSTELRKIMKKYLISLSVIIALIINLTVPIYSATAQEVIQRPTEPEKACDNQNPELLKKETNGNFTSIKKLDNQIDKGEIKFNYAKFQEEFEKIQEQYHGYVDCVFNFAETEILGKVGISQGTIQANTPAFDLMDPKAACLNTDKLIEIKNKTTPNQLLTPLLEIQSIYSDYLDALKALYESKGTETGGAGTNQLKAMSEAYTGIDLVVESEKESALVAMDIAFKSLKELRLAFFMHVHFQCMLNNLEKYRKWLEDIRIIVESLPGMLQDCSMTK
jgi:hypothetical protein